MSVKNLGRIGRIKAAYSTENTNTFPSLAGAKVAYLKQLKYEDFHRKRLLGHIRSEVFGTNEYASFVPAKKTGRRMLKSRLKGPIVTSFYEDTDDKVTYSMTRNRKLQMQSITDYEQNTLFTYRRRKNRFWKQKIGVQMGKVKLAEKRPAGTFTPMYKYRSIYDTKSNFDMQYHQFKNKSQSKRQ